MNLHFRRIHVTLLYKSLLDSSGNSILCEERKTSMFPMDYEEFRWALGDNTTIPLLKKAYDAKIPLGEATSRKMMRNFRLYMLVGGMPQAVNEYITTNNFRKVDLVKRDILKLYEKLLKDYTISLRKNPWLLWQREGMLAKGLTILVLIHYS